MPPSILGVRSVFRAAIGTSAAIVVAACAGNGDARATRRAAAPPIRFDSIGISATEGDCTNADSACARVEILYPLAESETHHKAVDAIHKAVGEWILGRPGDDTRSASPDTVAAEFISAFLDVRRANPALKPRWNMVRVARVALDTLGVITLHGIQQDFQGMTHGTTNAFWATFDLETGRRLGVADLAAPADSARLVALVEAGFRHAREFSPAASLADSGFFPATRGRLTLPDNIALTREGVVLHYNPTEVASYNAGPTTVKLTWTALHDLIPPSSPAHRFTP